MRKILPLILMAAFVSLAMPAASLAETACKDGTYQSSNDMMDIAVTIKDGKISAIEILKHRGGGAQYGKMMSPLIERIILSQTIEVDGVTGATVSSNSLKQAINAALEKARE